MERRVPSCVVGCPLTSPTDSETGRRETKVSASGTVTGQASKREDSLLHPTHDFKLAPLATPFNRGAFTSGSPSYACL